MKKIFLTLICVLFFCTSHAQNRSEFAKVYIKRANIAMEEKADASGAIVLFEKAMTFMDTITKSNVAKLGCIIYFKVDNFRKSSEYSKQYFALVKNKNSEEYMAQLEMAVTLSEKLEKQIADEKKIEEEKQRIARQLRRIDSLKVIWNKTSEKLSFKADSIYEFNVNNYALYRLNDKFGIINDKAEIIIEAKDYQASISYEGYIILKNKETAPTVIYCFNTNLASGFLLPSPADFNSLSTNYGKVMFPRADGRLVTYPSNSFAPMVYDLNQNEIVKVSNREQVFKYLKQKGVIRKYNKEGEVRIDKNWYTFGGHLGGGIHPLYFQTNSNVHAFLCSIDGTLLLSSKGYEYIGAFYDNKAQVIKDATISWINQNGTKISDVKDKMAEYTGNSKIVKLEDGFYQVFKDGIIVKGDDTLEKLPDFLRKFNK